MKVQPKWQRARILRSISYPQIVGREIWVTTGLPRDQQNVICDGQPGVCPEAVRTNLLSAETGVTTYFWSSQMIERLGDFCDDPPIVPWAKFLAGE
jgi:hypothetical protein